MKSRSGSCFRNLTIAFVLPFVLSFSPLVFGQRDTGSVAGRVVDPAGAVVQDAQVTVTEVDKQLVYNAKTGSTGEFFVSPLPIGRYSVQVAKTGFATAIAGPVEVDVQQVVSVNVDLKPGAVSEKVEVTDVAAQLDTLTSDLGQVVQGDQIEDLPLNGRNFAQVALLTAGVSPGEPGGRATGNYGFSSNGARSYQNNFMLDGIDNNSNLTDLFNGASYVTEVSVDSLQEMRVQTNAYSAEFSRGNGAVVNATIKSGTNAFHGDVFEFVRNQSMDAENYFATSKPVFTENQFGGTIGGPLIHDRTFFFADYQGLQLDEGNVSTGYVPTMAERGGDFSSLIDYSSQETGVVDCNGNPTYAGEIFNTRLTQSSTVNSTGQCGVPFGYTSGGMPSNVIPSNLFDSASAQLVSKWGQPNVNGSGYNYVSQPEQTTTQNNVDVRVDHRFSKSDSMFARYSFENQPSTIQTIFQSTGGFGVNFGAGIQDYLDHNLGASETHVFSPNLINEVRFGLNRINAHRYPWGYQQDLSANLGIPGIPFGPNNGGLPEFDFNGYTGIGDHSDLPTVETQKTFQYSDTLTWVKGSHSIKAGADILPEPITISQPNAARGDFGFQQQFTDNPGDPGTGGDSIATFLLGIPTYTQITGIINIQYQRLVHGYFFQGDYRLNKRLTLNLGLRWDYFGNVTEKNDHQANVLIDSDTIAVPKGVTTALTPTVATLFKYSATAPRGLVKQKYDAWAPRIGFAYRFSTSDVLRAGYGLFFNGYENGPWSNPSPGYNPPFNASQYYNTTCSAPAANASTSGLNCVNTATPTLSSGIPANALTDPNSPSLTELNPGLGNPLVQQYHATVEHQFPHDALFEFGYAGSHGSNLYAWFNGNQATPSSDPSSPTAPRRPLSLVDSSINELNTQSYSNYDALQARLEKRMTHNLYALVSYSWAHARDNQSSANLGSANNSGTRFFRELPDLDYGNADFDVRHRFVGTYTYELPIGKGHSLGKNLSPLANAIAGGWRNSTILTLQTGNWYTVTDGNSNFANSDGQQNPDLAGNPNGRHCVTGTLFNTCAFKDPALGSLGGAGRNIVQEPGSITFDTSLFKDFRVRETARFELRGELFNVLNHPNLSSTNLSFGSGSFGYANSVNSPRQIQLAGKFYF